MRILIEHNNRLCKLISLKVGDRDGSLVVVLLKGGLGNGFVRWTEGASEGPEEERADDDHPRSKRITIHQSGRVNYHWGCPPIYIDPLMHTVNCMPVCKYVVPSMDHLDEAGNADGNGDGDATLPLSSLDWPIEFSIWVCPFEAVPASFAVKIAFETEGYSLIVAATHLDAGSIPEGFAQRLAVAAPTAGPYAKQKITEQEAYLQYQQAPYGRRGMILSGPNGEGFFALTFSVPMRIAPKLVIEFKVAGLHVRESEVIRDPRLKTVGLRFKVRDERSGAIIKDPSVIQSIELDAEL